MIYAHDIERKQIAAKLWAMIPNVRRVFIGDVLSEFVSELISEPFSLPVRIAGSQLIVESFQKNMEFSSEY